MCSIGFLRTGAHNMRDLGFCLQSELKFLKPARSITTHRHICASDPGVRTFFRAFYAAYPSRRRLPSIVSHTVPPSSLKYLILSVLYRLSHPSSSSMNSAWETPRQSRP